MKTPPKKSRPAGTRKPGLAGALEQPGSNARQATYVLRLYVSGSTLKSARAVKNIKRICEQHSPGQGTTVTAWIPLPSPEESGTLRAAIA